MIRLALAIVLLLAACARDEAPPAPRKQRVPPPPTAKRLRNVEIVGRVVDATGLTVDTAHITIHNGTRDCQPAGPPTKVDTNERGEILAAMQVDVGRCLVVEAKAGGTRGVATVPVTLTTSRVELRVRLDRAPQLTRTIADGAVGTLRSALAGNRDAISELATYARFSGEPLRVGLADMSMILGRVADAQLVTSEPNRFVYQLVGTSGHSLGVEVNGDATIGLHAPLLHYGPRGRAFVTRFIELVATGDVPNFARLLNPDDVDVPEPKARAILDRFRAKLDFAGARYELVRIDETRHRLHYRIVGVDGKSVPIELVYGDGLVGLDDPALRQ